MQGFCFLPRRHCWRYVADVRFVMWLVGALLGWALWWVIFLSPLLNPFFGPLFEMRGGTLIWQPFPVLMALVCFFVFPVMAGRSLAEWWEDRHV